MLYKQWTLVFNVVFGDTMHTKTGCGSTYMTLKPPKTCRLWPADALDSPCLLTNLAGQAGAD